VPAEVPERVELRGGPVVDLLVQMRAGIDEPQVARLPVEREAVRIADAERRDLPPRARRSPIEAKKLAEKDAHVLRAPRLVAIRGVVVGAAVSEPDPQAAALVECD